jgi:two-component system heavy metal sensor histidine kinase CusS
LSLTARLIIGYTLGCVTCLLVVGWLSNNTLRDRFEKKNADLLADHLAELRQTVLDHPGDLHEAAEMVLISSVSHRVDSYCGRLSDAQGTVFAASPGFDQVVPDIAAFPPPVAAEERPGLPQLGRLSRPSGELFLLSAKVRQAGDRPDLVYQAVLNAGHVEEWLTDYNRKLGLFIAIATVASALFGWLVARSGLAPLRDISHSMRQVTAAGLGARLGARPWPAELAALATEFDRMLERLDESFNRLSQFTADAAHEFRTPLNNLTGATSLLLSRDRSDAERREALAAHLEQYERLNRMIESLLFLARADGKTETPELHPLAAGRLVREVVEFFAPLAEDSGVALTTSGDATVLADEALLRMALSNLIANALRFTPSGGSIAVAITQPAPGRALLTVADTGCGIAPEHLPRIFDRFYRVEAARSSGGAGLGLALVQTIMTLHHGSVAVTSEVGRGTKFQLTFPELGA